MNQHLERVPSHLEHPAPRVIVHVLMAPSKFTLTKRTTAFTAKLITDLAKRKV
ncbi:hypothetical protein NC651_001277 [Populus alba x Populus x berolinensis]|nr:hypothetical protein NC651_001277 [Populus alba x Populus x berolinensis]